MLVEEEEIMTKGSKEGAAGRQCCNYSGRQNFILSNSTLSLAGISQEKHGVKWMVVLDMRQMSFPYMLGLLWSWLLEKRASGYTKHRDEKYGMKFSDLLTRCE